MRGETVATLRWLHVRLMETLASWVPTTPEMEVKLLFGSHVWDVAQHADALGKRTFELRMPLQHSLEPQEPYRQLIVSLGEVKDTAQRLALFYEGVLPALASRYRGYLEQTDDLLDAPTVRIFQHIANEQGRMIVECEELLRQLPELRLQDRGIVENFRAQESAIDKFAVHRDEQAAA
jgi:hypothetical protein